jgi:hypothetical protein
MWILAKRIGGAALAGLAALGLASSEAQAQLTHVQFFRPPPSAFSPVSPFSPFKPFARSLTPAQKSDLSGIKQDRQAFLKSLTPKQKAQFAAGARQATANALTPLAQQQAMNNALLAGTMASRATPFQWGFNPYAAPAYPMAAPMVTPAAGGGYGGATNPYIVGTGGYGGGGGGTSNPYGQGGGGGAVDPNNPYSSALAATAPSNSYAPYTTDPYSGSLFGSADLTRALGSMMMDQERARVMRELALQAKQQTRKMKFDTDMYIREHTPTFTDEQAKIAATLVKRIQTMATPGEIGAGRAANTLLNDLAKHTDRNATAGKISLDGDILRRINIMKANGSASIGLLRNDGVITWPPALLDLVSAEEKSEIDNLAKGVYELAVDGKASGTQIRNLEVRVQKLQDMLRSKVNDSDLPSSQFLAGLSFLNQLQSAVRALQQGAAPINAEWRRHFREGGTVQDVTDWLLGRGLRIAPATDGDEDAYQAFHDALAAYDVGVNAQLASNR